MDILGVFLVLFGFFLRWSANNLSVTSLDDLKFIDFAEDMFVPCIIVGGVFLALGFYLDVKNYKKKKKMYTCNKCGADVLEDEEFCSVCGSVLRLRCPYCKELYDERPSFCRKCGRDLTCMCPECSSLLKEDEKFCHRCGTQVK